MKQRMTDLENQMACKVDKTLDLVQILDERQREQGARLAEVQQAVKEQSQRDKAREASIQSILQRIEQLEGEQASSRTWRTTLFEGENGVGPRAPALVLGGWKVELEEQEVKDEASRMVRELELDIDLAEAFMPGKQKGYLIVPLQAQAHEDRIGLQRRAIAAVETKYERPRTLPEQKTTEADPLRHGWR